MMMGILSDDETSACVVLPRLLGKAQEWLAWAATAAKSRAPLKRMREVLHAGLRLGVEVPQVDELRLEIRRREWEELAKKVPLQSHPLALLVPPTLLMLLSSACLRCSCCNTALLLLVFAVEILHSATRIAC